MTATGIESWPYDRLLRLLAHAGALYDLAWQYASECGECNGTGVWQDEPCTDCAEIRAILDAIDRPEVTP